MAAYLLVVFCSIKVHVQAACDDADGVNPVALGAVHCADEQENEYCYGPGVVYYGYGAQWVTKQLGDWEAVLCTNTAIGCDPVPNVYKDCYLLAVNPTVDPTSNPTSSPTPNGTMCCLLSSIPTL